MGGSLSLLAQSSSVIDSLIPGAQVITWAVADSLRMSRQLAEALRPYTPPPVEPPSPSHGPTSLPVGVIVWLLFRLLWSAESRDIQQGSDGGNPGAEPKLSREDSYMGPGDQQSLDL
jgi:hypothetical protein